MNQATDRALNQATNQATNQAMDHCSGEQEYLTLMGKILKSGYDKPSRTGVATRFVTGAQLRFQLTRDDGAMILPLLTTKFVSFKLVMSELLWLVAADCNSQTLAGKYNNHIWDANGSREALDSRGLQNREIGDLGPVYGWQWRKWNAPYGAPDAVAPGKPKIDQLQLVIDGIKRDPWGRRHIVSAWNPEQLDEMALPPCHVMFQFIVRPGPADKPTWLDCMLTQRSGDVPLGIPFNIASYSLLTHMVAHLTGLKAGTLIHNIGDAHIYHNQFDGCETQITRKPKLHPTIAFNHDVLSIDDFDEKTITLQDYVHDPKINFPMSQ